MRLNAFFTNGFRRARNTSVLSVGYDESKNYQRKIAG